MAEKKRSGLWLLGILCLPAIITILVISIWLGPLAIIPIITAPFQISRPADTEHVNEVSGTFFSLQYPSNWKVDTGDPDYDPDKYLDIDAPGNGTVMISVFSPDISPRHGADVMLESMRKLVMGAETSTFESWGPHVGWGLELEGLLRKNSGFRGG